MVSIPELPALEVAPTVDLSHEEGGLALLVKPGGDVHADLAIAYGVDLTAVVRAKKVGAARTSHTITLPPLLGNDPWRGRPRTLVLVGIGDGGLRELREAGLTAGRAARGLSHLAVVPGEPLEEAGLTALAEGLLLASYRMPRRGEPDDDCKTPCPAVAIGATPVDLGRVRAAVWGTFLARTLAATPSDTKSPVWLAEQARELVAGEKNDRLSCEVRDETWLAEAGLAALLAVGRGSQTPPRLAVVRYAGAPGAPIVLVGKGITFDTGGLSLKLRESMVTMKTDMSGAAIVLATVLAAARAQLPVHVIGVLPLAENAFGGASYRPGDVVQAQDGTTVEILNTDAEGRLVLADALAWARHLNPRILLDVATLTGAATLGLGRGHGALFASEEHLAEALVESGSRAGEDFWHMPLVEDYRRSLRSEVADIAHIATDDTTKAGAVVAALFLERFTCGTPWAHLDIAGPARASSATPELGAHAPTGFGVRALLDWLSR